MRRVAPVCDVMKKNVVRISADDTLWIVKEIMDLGSVRHIPVVDRGVLVGVVSQRDLLRASLSNIIGISAEEQKMFLDGVRISEVMSVPPVTISPDDTIQTAARMMAENKIGCLPVVDGREIVGILTETDVLRHFAMLPTAR